MFRRSTRLHLLSLFLIGFSLLSASSVGGQDTLTPADIEDLQRQLKKMMTTINAQKVEIDVLRQELAASHLREGQNEDELNELQRFIEDYHKMDETFEEYKGNRAEAEAKIATEKRQEAKERYAQIKAQRKQRYEAALEQRRIRKAEQKREARYRKAGFSPIGLDVYASTFSYYYKTVDATRSRIDWRSGFGHYERLYPGTKIDFANMTISGSVLNSTDETRNIGVAITFFDEQGTQVGHEIVQVENARTNVPYPFTAELKMALNRPFESSSIYVLYADPISPEDKAAPSSQPGN